MQRILSISFILLSYLCFGVENKIHFFDVDSSTFKIPADKLPAFGSRNNSSDSEFEEQSLRIQTRDFPGLVALRKAGFQYSVDIYRQEGRVWTSSNEKVGSIVPTQQELNLYRAFDAEFLIFIQNEAVVKRLKNYFHVDQVQIQLVPYDKSYDIPSVKIGNIGPIQRNWNLPKNDDATYYRNTLSIKFSVIEEETPVLFNAKILAKQIRGFWIWYKDLIK